MSPHSLPVQVDNGYHAIYEALVRGAKNSPSPPPISVEQAMEDGWKRGLSPLLALLDAGMDTNSIRFLLVQSYAHRVPHASEISSSEVERFGGVAGLRTVGALPLGRAQDNVYELICIDPLDGNTHRRVSALCPDSSFRVWVCTNDEFDRCVSDLSASDIQSGAGALDFAYDDDDYAVDAGADAQAQLFFNEVLSRAVADKASDIHMELLDGNFCVRARVDGQLRVYKRVPITSRAASAEAGAIIRRVLLNAEQQYNKFKAIDGHIAQQVNGKTINCRLSYMPGFIPASMPPPYAGEKIVLRIIGSTPLTMDELNLSDRVLGQFREMLRFPHGLILLSGPTGSGKSTSMYAALQALANDSRAIYTIEDPPEIYFPSIHQVSVNQQMRFADALKAFMRADPDIILVGEIRDEETATTTFHAASTGRLVLSSIHVNNAAQTPIRLMDMKVEPFRVSDSLVGVINQRLVQKLCPSCKLEQDPDEVIFDVDWGDDKPDVVYKERPGGCPNCKNHGFLGRQVVAEAIVMSPQMRTAIAGEGTDAYRLQQLAIGQGMVPILHDALRLVRKGEVSLQEVARQIDLEDRLNK